QCETTTALETRDFSGDYSHRGRYRCRLDGLEAEALLSRIRDAIFTDYARRSNSHDVKSSRARDLSRQLAPDLRGESATLLTFHVRNGDSANSRRSRFRRHRRTILFTGWAMDWVLLKHRPCFKEDLGHRWTTDRDL